MNIKRMCGILSTLILVVAVASITWAQLPAVPIHVSVSKGTVLSLKEPSPRVSISNPDVAEVNVISPTEVLINGKKVGVTSLIIWEAKKPKFFDVIVSGDISQLQDQIKEMAPNDEIKAELANDTIILSGYATNQDTINKVVQVAQAYAVASDVVTTTKYSAGLTSSDTKSSGKVINHIIIKDPQQVLLEVKVAQVDKSKLKEFGLSTVAKGRDAEGFTNLVGAPSGEVDTENFIGRGISTHGEGIMGILPGLGGITPLDPYQIGVSYFPGGIGFVLKALSSKGLAKILAEPNLTVRSGEKGAFHVGTRFPVQKVTGTGADASVSVEFEEVGIRLNFAPEVLETGIIRLKVDPAEVSNITDFVRLQDLIAPIIDARTVKTSVDLKEGESLVLAGLLSDEMKKNIKKVPLLGDIPILGALFRSTTDELREKELVFFITPKLVRAMPQGVKQELPGEKPLTPQEENEFNWIPLAPTRP